MPHAQPKPRKVFGNRSPPPIYLKRDASFDNEVMIPPLINALPIFEAWCMWAYLSSPLPIIAKLKKKTKWAEQDSNL